MLEKTCQTKAVLYQGGVGSIFFPQGLVGFHHIKEMSLSFFKNFKNKPLYLLNALHYTHHAWVVVEHHSLDLPTLDTSDLLIFYTLKLLDSASKETGGEKLLEATLLAPIYIDMKTGQGFQTVVTQAAPESVIMGSLSILTS